MDLFLRDKVAVVSGGSRGIGLHIALALAEEECRLSVCARDQAGLDRALEMIRGQGAEAVGVAVDVTQEAGAGLFLHKTVAAFGGVDLLVNNVGGSSRKGLAESTGADWDEVFRRNFFHAVALSRGVLPEMKKRGGGAILNIASIYGRESGGGMIYNASKAALISFSKALANQTAKDNIRVNALAPGSILFPGGAWDRRMRDAPDGLRGFIESELPLGRFGRPEEVAAVAVFLLSPRASLIHGACVTADGSQSRSNI